MRRPRPPPATLACAQAPPRPLPLCGWTAELQHPRAPAGPEFQRGRGRMSARARAPVHTGLRPPEGRRLKGTRLPSPWRPSSSPWSSGGLRATFRGALAAHPLQHEHTMAPLPRLLWAVRLPCGLCLHLYAKTPCEGSSSKPGLPGPQLP